MEWQPIKTAPSDIDLLIYCPNAIASYQILVAHYFGDGSRPDDVGVWYSQEEEVAHPIDCEATHWMPLPTPPESAKP